MGDHKQLGPTVLNKKVIDAGFKQSMFERLLKLNYVPYLLSTQYRMPHSLCEFPSSYFYDGYLQSHHNEPISIYGLPENNFFYSCSTKEEVSQSGTSYLNTGEAKLVEMIIKHLFKSCGVIEQQIGVITPYEGQKTHILNLLGISTQHSLLEISNVDGFQGREKDFIIVSLVRSNNHQAVGFVGDGRRMNVTITRAKQCLIIIGNPFTLYKSKIWADLLDFYENKKSIYEGNMKNRLEGNMKSWLEGNMKSRDGVKC